jgi:beta-glucosidase-like glycosyl hydrolase
MILGLVRTCQAQDERWVDSTLASLSLEEKVGQLFVAELVALYTHEDHPAFQYALDRIRRFHVGTFILGGGSVLDIPLVTNKLQQASRVPLLINGDLESGMTYIQPWRLSRGWSEDLPKYIAAGGTQFPSQMAIGATFNPRFAYQFGRITALEARAIGIHWSNSPVADVNNNPDNSIINTRSYGEDPASVAAMVEAYVRGAQEAGMIATLKHFPGHGDTREDTHMKLPLLPFDLARLRTVELVPFRAGIAAGAKAVMTAHLALPRIDSTGRPATLSRPILTGILRTMLGFNGIVVTDGMRMQGITDHYSSAEAAVSAIEAGADAVLGPEDIGAAFTGVVDAVHYGRLSMARIDTSVRRILRAKAWVGLDRRRTVDVDAVFHVVGSPAFQSVAREISDSSVTLLRNEGGLLPLPREIRLQYIAVTEDPAFTPGIDFINEISPYVASATLSHVSNETGRERLAELRSAADAADAAVVGVYLSVTAWTGGTRFSPQLQEFLESLGKWKKPVILVAYGDPYIIGKLPQTQVILTPYNGTGLAEQSVVRGIAGKLRFNGRLPVTIPGRFRRGEGLRGEK